MIGLKSFIRVYIKFEKDDIYVTFLTKKLFYNNELL